MLHYPGYLTVTTKTFVDQYNSAKRPTLLLSWIPNSALCKCPSADENFTSDFIRSPLSSSSYGKLEKVQMKSYTENDLRQSKHLENGETAQNIVKKDDETATVDMQELRNELQPLLGGKKASIEDLEALIKKNPITSVNITISNPQIENANISQTFNGVVVSDPEHFQLNTDGSVSDDNNPNWMTPELLAFKHNLAFPDSANATPTGRRKLSLKCRRFSVDLSQMRSLRLFFNDNSCTSGQLVIASRESQYKILHFHYGGLDHLAQEMATANGNDIRVADLQILDDGDDERNMEYDSSGSESIVDANIEGNIIMDAEGNYYYQSSASVVKVEPLQKISGTPVKMVPAVVIPQSKRKNAGGDVNGHHDIWGSTNTNEIADATPDSLNKKYKIEISEVKILKTENDATKANETLTSEIDNQEKVYEFDENEQDPDDPEEVHNPDCESKGIIKPAKKNSSKEPEQFSCMVCTYKTNKKFLLSRHLKTHCLERPYKCEVCERGFKTNAALMNHRNIHLGRKPHACASCDKAFTTSGELVRHVRYRHTHIKPHKCTECDYSSVEMSKLRRHMRCHTGERPYQCPHCTYASPDTFKLKRHMRIHTGEKPYECDICHARFTQSNSLKHHRLIHSVSEKPVFQCHLCPTTCGRKSDLRLHIKNLHNSDQPLPCKRCGKELPDRYTYKLHIKTHDGEKCFRCDYCPYASISQRHLDTHVLIHLDAKPFVCEICQSSFRQKQLYARHKRIYHSDNYEPVKKLKKDHKCPHCNKVFAFNGNLIRHMEVHDPDSHRFEELDKLKLGRLKRVQPDGSVVTVSPFHKFTRLNNESKGLHDNKTEAEQQIEIHDPNSYQIVGNNTVNYEHLPSSSKFSQSLEEKDDLIYDETEEQIEDEEMHEEEYDETEVYNEQYVYDEYECEEHIEEVQYEGEKEEINEKPLLMNIKQEKEQPTNTVPTILKDTIKTEQKTVTKIMRLENQDDQDFMIIEVLPDDEDNEEQLNQEQNVKEDVQSKKAIPFTLNKNAHKSKSNNTVKISQSLISDYFGFEENDDEDDEETKGAIKLLHMIENE